MSASAQPISVLADLVIGIDHVGLAVSDLDEAIEKWTTVFGAKLHSREINAEQGVEEAMLEFGQGSALQLLASLSPDSPIGVFLANRGEGMQQLAIRVSDIALATEKLQAAGIETLSPAARIGTGGSSINFIHPKFTGGVLLELVEFN